MTQKLSKPRDPFFEESVALRPLEEVPGGAADGSTTDRIRLLWMRRSFLLKVSGYGLVVAALIAFLIPKRYTSTARLMPPDDSSGSGLAMAAAALGGRSGALGSVASELTGLKSTSDVFVGILGSNTVADQLIQQFSLKKVYGDSRIEDARKGLEQHTDVSVDRKSQIITITVTDRSATRAAAMAGAYIAELNRLVSQLSTSSARRERVFLEGRLQEVNHDLETAEKSFSQFASRNTAIDIPAQGRAMVEAAAVLQGQLIAAESELQGLKQIYSDNNVRVRSLTARVAELQSQLNQLGGKDDKGTSSSGQDSIYPSIRKLPLLGVAYADLYRETKVQEAIYETLTQEYEIAKVQVAKEIPTVKVLDPPDVPEKKSFPPRALIILSGTALAVACGMMWIFADSAWRKTLATDPRKMLAQEVFHTMKAHLPWETSNGAGHTLGTEPSHVLDDNDKSH